MSGHRGRHLVRRGEGRGAPVRADRPRRRGVRAPGDRLRDRRHPAAGTRDADARARRSQADRFDVVYAAGGTPNALFPIAPADWLRASGGTVADVALSFAFRLAPPTRMV
jgi:hypothetical protein